MGHTEQFMRKDKIKMDKGIGNILKKYRIQIGLSKKEVAKLIGLRTPNEITKWENGESFPRSCYLLLLCEVYDPKSNNLYYLLQSQITGYK